MGLNGDEDPGSDLSRCLFPVGRHFEAPDLWNPKKRKPQDNGWGFVVQTDQQVVYAHGTLPSAFIERFTTRRGFIYMLEVLACV